MSRRSLPTLASESLDAELLRLDREHDAAFKRACTLVAPDNDELTEACAAYTDIEFAIQRIPAETWAGVAVKARIAANYFRKYPEGQVLDDIGPSLIEDILRLANVTAKTDETYGGKHKSCPVSPLALLCREPDRAGDRDPGHH